ncbi:hypothetical protein A2U01_0116769, partial [Trifolium medium]|nr:hypothetical protein [Trifolium medium]
MGRTATAERDGGDIGRNPVCVGAAVIATR